MDETIESIELRRLHELAKNAALHGPNTNPEILIEIAELRHKYGVGRSPERRQMINNLDYDFLMNVVSATLIRFNVDKEQRRNRQLIHDIWMVAITVLVILSLLLQLTSR